MPRIIGLSGSLRKGSFNTALLRAAAGLMPEGWELEVRTLHGIPVYDGDEEEASGVPPAVEELKDAVAGARGLLISTPEYNNSIPGVLKNGLDWMTRPPADAKRVFAGRPVAMMGATPGPYGTTLSQVALLPVLRTLGTNPWFGGRLLVGNADEIFDAAGSLVKSDLRERLRVFLAGFAAFAGAQGRPGG